MKGGERPSSGAPEGWPLPEGFGGGAALLQCEQFYSLGSLKEAFPAQVSVR